ncbi:PREDICTED: uncharacterized protein LOC106541438 [Thamnophis sirtalis]|uniref:Uncharacterized protein LOC106541438 n=1 Tax=Thamnophis sirtalis TaxID=35019 RepID=A0A6I9XDT1_9SAUR|nr:PREDICTED: uncharacterized protein LOC106541438 [Thamnophis sirtalis]
MDLSFFPFQPSDAQCPCAPGYRSHREDRRWDCVKETYDICKDDAVRNQDGRCLTKEEWAHYCSDQVCDIPQDYRGYDKVLRLCLCQVRSLDNMCGLLCRRRQGGVLKFFCGDGPARLSIAYKNGRQVDIFWEELAASLQGLIFHAQNLCASETQDPQRVYVVKTNGKDQRREMVHILSASDFPSGFIANSWPPNLQREQLSNPFGKDFAALTGKKTGWISAKGGFRFSQPEPANATPKSTLTGILNPTVCLKMHEILMFVVSKEHYPVYDVNNLYNTNQDFDWGSFRKLAEEMQLASSSTSFSFFLHQFNSPGTYVLRLSSNQHKKMKYIRMLPFGGQCYEEGPFYPTTPAHVVQVGIAKIADLVLKPDWPAIIGILIALIFLILIYLVLIVSSDNDDDDSQQKCILVHQCS